MSVRMMSKAWDFSCKNHTEKLVLLALSDNANDNGECFPSMGHLARKCDMTEQGVRNIIKRFEKSGFLAVDRSGTYKRSNVYTVSIPPISQPQPPNTVGGTENDTPPNAVGGTPNTVEGHPPIPLGDPPNTVGGNHQLTTNEPSVNHQSCRSDERRVRFPWLSFESMDGDWIDEDGQGEEASPSKKLSEAKIDDSNHKGGVRASRAIPPKAAGAFAPECERIRQAYPLKAAKPVALRAIAKALKTVPFEELLAKTQAFAAVRNGDLAYCPNPATWFNQERYNDDPSTWTRSNGAKAPESKLTDKEVRELRDLKEMLPLYFDADDRAAAALRIAELEAKRG